jgi:hypothetical protein
VLNRLRARWRPETYQGPGSKGRNFEGWYYKIVDEQEEHKMAVIPGVSFGEPSDHAFVQVLDGSRYTYDYHKYEISEFNYSRDEFQIEIGPNVFRGDRMELHIRNENRNLEGVLHFDDIHPWPARIWSPGAMGALGFVPGIPCYHHVLSLDHQIMGQLSMGNKMIDFDGGRGYTEKNWGMTFPSSWIWIQSNHFEDPGMSFILAAAHMNFHARPIRGLTCGLMRGKNLYRFCTWSGGRITTVDAEEGEVRLCLESPKYYIDVEAIQSTPTEVRTPHMGTMTGRALESLSSLVSVSLRSKNDDKPMLDDTGRCAGFEMAGNVGKLASDGG